MFFYNACFGQLISGKQLNNQRKLGFSDGGHYTLIHPQVAVTVAHGGLRKKIDCREPVSFYGKPYTILKKVEPADAKPEHNDLCLVFLDKPVMDWQGLPLVDYSREHDFRGAHLHMLSHNKRFLFKNNPVANPNGPLDLTEVSSFTSDMFYGQCFAGNQMVHDGMLRVSPSPNKEEPSLATPVGGDSGSPCYAELDHGRWGLVGVVSGVNDRDQASYTLLAPHIKWIEEQCRQEHIQINFETIPMPSRPSCAPASQDPAVREDLPLLFDPFLYVNAFLDLFELSQKITSAAQQSVEAKMREEIAKGSAIPKEDQESRIQRARNKAIADFAIDHYLNYGRQEGRGVIFLQGFDPQKYLDNNPDVLDHYALPKTEERLGKETKEKGPSNRTERRLSLYQYAIEHYLNQGRKEKRKIHNFSHENYLAQYTDITPARYQPKFSEELRAIDHYIHYGIRESRTYFKLDTTGSKMKRK